MAPAATPQSLRGRLAAGGAWAIIGKGGTLGLNFLAVALITRVLQPSDAGAYFLSQSVVNGTALLARLGLESTVVYLVSSALGVHDPGRARRMIRQILLIGGVSAAVMGAALALGGGAWLGRVVFHSPLVARVGTIAGIWSAALALQTLVSEAFRGFHAIREAVLFGGVITGAVTILALAAPRLVGTTLSLESAVWIAGLSTVTNVAIGGLTLAVRSRSLGPVSPPDAAETRTIFASAMPALVNNVMTYALLNVDIWVIGAHLPERDVAAYAAAARMATLVQLSLMISNQVLPPVIGELFARKERERLERILRGTAAVVAPPAFLIVAAFLFLGPFIMRLGFGSFYERGGGPLVLLGMGQLAGVLTGSSVPVLLMTGNQRAAMIIAAVAAVAAGSASLLVVGPFGASGVAAATSAVIVLQQLATLFAARRLAGIWTHASVSEIRTALREMRDRRRRT